VTARTLEGVVEDDMPLLAQRECLVRDVAGVTSHFAPAGVYRSTLVTLLGQRTVCNGRLLTCVECTVDVSWKRCGAGACAGAGQRGLLTRARATTCVGAQLLQRAMTCSLSCCAPRCRCA
jgi:hypothetical protein